MAKADLSGSHLLRLTAVAVLAFASVGMALGPDRTWDFIHYHLYLPYSVLQGRGAIDHNAADIHTFLNPTLDIALAYPLYVFGGEAFMSACLGALQGINWVLVYVLAYRLTQGEKGVAAPDQHRLAVLVACVAMGGAMVLAEVGKTHGDLVTSIPALGAIIACMRGLNTQEQRSQLVWISVGGLMMGLATGLKLTNATMLCGLASAVALCGRDRRYSIVTVFSLAALAGIAIGYGWWGVRLWELTGNPFFPYFNGYFHSPLYPEVSYFDRRWMPWSWKQAIIYPFYFSWTGQSAETPFKDFRYAVGYVVVFLLAGRLLSHCIAGKTISRPRLPRNIQVLLVFTSVSYVLWLSIFSIQRYAIVIELVLPILLLSGLTYLYGNFGRGMFFVLVLVFALTTRPSNYNLVNDWNFDAAIDPAVRAELANSIEGAAVVLGMQPIAILAPLMRDVNVAWFGEIRTEADRQQALAKLRNHDKVFAISHDKAVHHGGSPMFELNMRLESLKLPPVDQASCTPFSVGFHVHRLLLCDVKRIAPK